MKMRLKNIIVLRYTFLQLITLQTFQLFNFIFMCYFQQINVKGFEEPKTILFWTSWFNRTTVEEELQISFDGCPINNCRTTQDRSKVNESDAVFFHIYYVDKLEPLPTYRRPDQRYIMMSFESPSGPLVDRELFKNIPPHFFNWTATYRLDSELFRKSIYGGNFKKNENVSHYSGRPLLNDYYGINITSKNKSVAWFASRCKTSINREGYIAELQKHIPVDVFGKCLSDPKSCPRNNSKKCDDMLHRDYFFYLSFENSFCPDYVTEKFYRAFETGTVPVVFGGGNYSSFAPDHSYINARDFKSPKLLAEYLNKLTLDRDLYSHYFDWRRDFNLESKATQLKKNSCKLCEMLHDPTLPTKSYPNIEEWWYEDLPCENFSWPTES